MAARQQQQQPMASASWPGIALDSKWKNRRQLQLLLQTAPAVSRQELTDIYFRLYPVAVRYLFLLFFFSSALVIS